MLKYNINGINYLFIEKLVTVCDNSKEFDELLSEKKCILQSIKILQGTKKALVVKLLVPEDCIFDIQNFKFIENSQSDLFESFSRAAKELTKLINKIFNNGK